MIQMKIPPFYIQESKWSQYNHSLHNNNIVGHNNNNSGLLCGTIVTIWALHGYININKGYNYNSNGVITSIIGTQQGVPTLLRSVRSLSLIESSQLVYVLNNIVSTHTSGTLPKGNLLDNKSNRYESCVNSQETCILIT